MCAGPGPNMFGPAGRNMFRPAGARMRAPEIIRTCAS